MKIVVATWIGLAATTAIVLLFVDPRYYVMPGGTLPEGLPVLGTRPTERILNAGVAGAITSGVLVTGIAIIRSLYRVGRISQ